MKKIFFYKKLNPYPSKNSFYCNWIFNDNFIFSKNKFVNYTEDNFKEKLKLSNKYQRFVFNKIYKKLNEINKVNYSKRFWKILLNRWIKFYVDSLIFRYDYIKKNIEISKIKSFNFEFNNELKKTPNSLIDFFELLGNEERNNYISYKIAKLFSQRKNININVKKKSYFFRFSLFSQIYNIKGFKNNMALRLNFFLKFLIKNKLPVIVTSYLPRFKEFKIMLQNNYFFFWKNYFYRKNYELLKSFQENPVRRENIFITSKNDTFKNLLVELLNEFLPTCYFENFKKLEKFTEKNIIAKNSKYIFTSNEFLFNEFFKIYAAKLTNKGSKYFIGQHGGAYGTMMEQRDTVEEITSDKFFTWGWKYNKKHYPLGVLSTLGEKKQFIDSKIKNILIVMPNFERNVRLYNSYNEYMSMLKRAKTLLSKIDKDLIKFTKVRFHHEDKKFFNKLIKIFKNISKDLEIDFGENPIKKNLSPSTLIIYNYLSSGFFESLSLNYNCLALIDSEKKFYEKKFYYYVKRLKNKKLIFDDTSILARKISFLFKKNDTIQNNIKYNKFIKNYARYSKKINFINT